MIPRVLLLALVALALPACGYSTRPLTLNDSRTVALAIFENTTVRRGHEFDLTNAVARMLHARTPYRVASQDQADLILSGTILGYYTPALVEDRRDVVIESSVSITLNVSIADRSGKVVYQGSATRSAHFSTRRGESEESARAEVLDALARWVVTTLEGTW